MEELKRLAQRIEEADNAYYNSGRTIMSDSEYDALVRKAANLGYIETVGSRPVSELPKIKHEHLMLSLDKVHTQEELDKFIGNRKIVAMAKADGLTVSATYIDGILTRLETRGDGNVGCDIMVHAKSFENFPLIIKKPGKYVVDGECVILYDNFDKINSTLPDDQKYKNPRNLAAGTLNLLDPSVSAKRKMGFYVWDVITGGSYNSLADNLIEAEHLGFSIVITMTDASTSPIEPIGYIKRLAKEDGFPIDGVVIKYDDISLREKLGKTNHHFLNAIAYKFEDEKFPSTLRSCEWQVGKTGRITPLLVFDPVDISGSTVEKASAHNISILKQLHPRIGCTCYVVKANDIIPQVNSCDDDGSEEIEIPTTCPVCGKPTRIIKDNDSEILICDNPDCGGKLLGKLKHFVSRKGMDISGLSEQTLQKFISLGWLKSFLDIYKLPNHYDQIVNLDGFGRKSADNLMKALNDSRQNVSLVNFITALSIPGVGEGQSKQICKTYHTWEDFRDAREDPGSYQRIDGIGEVIDRSIRMWLKEEDNWVDSTALASIMHFEEYMNQPEGNFPLLGKTFVITGKVSHFKNRDEMKEWIEAAGGKVSGSVSQKTTFLINNDSTSASGKNKKAHDLGIPIISEDDLLKMAE